MRLPLAAVLLLSSVVTSCGGSDDGGSGQGGPQVFDGWAVRAGAASLTYEMPAKLGVYSDGSSVVVGTFSGDITFGEGEPNETTLPFLPTQGALFVARYAADGTLMWARSDGGPNWDYPYDVDVVPDGSCVVTGFCGDGTVFGRDEPTETTLHTEGAPQNAAFVARYAADGSLLWAVSAYGSSSGGGIGALPDGSCVVAGGFAGSVTFGTGEPNETTLDGAEGDWLFVARYAADGTLDWVRAGMASEEVRVWGVDTHADGSSFVTGELTGTLSLGPGAGRPMVEVTSLGDTDAFLLRYDGDGVPQWATTAGTPIGVVVGPGTAVGYDVAALLDGTAVVTGNFHGIAKFGHEEPNETILVSPNVFPNVFYARYGSSGDLLWAKRAGGLGGAYGNAIAAHDDGSIYVAGVFGGSTATFGPGEANETLLTSVAGSLDAFVARLFPDGRLRWARQAGGPESDGAVGIGVVPDHSCVTTGYFWDTAQFGSDFLGEWLTSAGGWDVFLAHYGPNGEH